MKKINLLITLFCLTFLWACETNQEATPEPVVEKPIEKPAEPQKEKIPEGLVFDPSDIGTYGIAPMRLTGMEIHPDLKIQYNELSGRIDQVENKGKASVSSINPDGSYTVKSYAYNKKIRFAYENWKLKRTTIIEERTYQDLSITKDSITEDFSYNGSKQPYTITITNHTQRTKGVYLFKYSGGKVENILFSNNKIISFKWEGDNIIETTRINRDLSEVTSNIKGYDQNKNIEGMVLNMINRPFSTGWTTVENYFSKNNPSEVNYFFAGEKKLNSYEYSALDNGFVTKKAVNKNTPYSFTWEQNPFLLTE